MANLQKLAHLYFSLKLTNVPVQIKSVMPLAVIIITAQFICQVPLTTSVHHNQNMGENIDWAKKIVIAKYDDDVVKYEVNSIQ
jgi:hypothetical protein